MGGGSRLLALGFRSTTNLVVLSVVRSACGNCMGPSGLKALRTTKGVRADSSGLKPDRNDKTFERRLIQVDVPSSESLQRTAKSPKPRASSGTATSDCSPLNRAG